MAEQTFTVVYDGPAVHSGSMDVRQLAPALLALGEVYQEAQRILYPDDQPLALEVRAAETGSFEVHLVLTQSLWQQAVNLFSGDGATAIANVIAYTTAAGGVVALLIRTYRRKVRGREELPSGMIRLILDDGTVLEVPREVLLLAESVTMRRAVKDVFEPLRSDGIEQVSFSREKVTELVVSKEEIGAFEVAPAGDELVNDVTAESVLSIASVAFQEGNKWRLSDGEQTFHATIADPAFLERVARDEVSFAKHDLLRCDVHMEQWRTDHGLRIERTVIRVIEHLPASRPVPLPFADPTRETARPE